MVSLYGMRNANEVILSLGKGWKLNHPKIIIEKQSLLPQAFDASP